MTAPTQPVTVRLADFGGPAVAGVTVKARLSDVDYTADGTFVSTETVSGVTDASGVVVLNVFPNAVGSGLGTRGTTVLFHASMIGSRSLKVEARVPNTPCNLTDILVPLGDVPLTEAELALMQVQASEALAQNWASSVSAPVADGLFSAREYAAGSQSGTGGSAKDWATKLGTEVSGGEFSAKFHAQAAGTSETNAAASRAAIDNRLYPGSASVDPTTRPDGTARQVGDGYFNSGIKAFKYWDGVQWGSYTSSAAAFAAAAAASAAAAAAVVTGGTGALVPAAGKLPLADGSGNIDPLWLKSSPKSRWFGKVASKLSKAITGKVRIGYSGTSIATFNSSPGAVWAAQLQRLFGDSGDRVNYLAFLGGTAQNVAFHGWDKQCFGGPQFSRLRGTNVSTAIDIFTTRCRFVAVRYSTETDGGSWSASLNGGTPQTINSAGAQSYRNEVVLDAGFDSIHKLTITPPAGSGVAYFEAYECRTEDNGVFVDNSTFGGSAANNMINGFTNNNGAGVPIIQPVGFTGVDCYFNAATKPDLFVWQYTVNDVGDGSAHFLTDYQSILDRAVTMCRQNDIPLILIIEPLGHLAFPITAESQGARDNAAGIRAYQLRVAADNEHVYVLDWHALTFINDIVRYTTVFYPVVVLSGGNTAYTGDFVHPVQPTGYTPAVMALCAATGIPMPFGTTQTLMAMEQRQETYGGASALHASTPAQRVNGRGFKKRITDQFGASHVVTEVGRAMTFQGDVNKVNAAPVFYSDTMVSPRISGFTGLPANSDKWGAYYLDATNSGGNLALPAGYAGFFTITALVSPITGSGSTSTSLSLIDTGFDAYMPDGQKVLVPAGLSPILSLTDWDGAAAGGRPVLVSATYKRGTSVSDAPGIRITGRVYAVWLTYTSFPVITERTAGTGTAATDLTYPMYRIGDPLWDQVIPGQEIIETINSKDVKKIALAAPVIKLRDLGHRYRAFRSKLESGIEVIRGQPEFTGTLVANGAVDNEYGGLVYAIGTARRHLFTSLASYAANYQGKTFTMMMRLVAPSGALKVGLLGAGNFGMAASLDVSNNVVWTEYATLNSAIASVGDTLVTLDPSWTYKNLAFTFTMPALTANMGAGNITPFFYVANAANAGYSYMVDGSSFLL